MTLKIETLKITGDTFQNIVEDTTPQLGGNLDVNNRSIISLSNIDIPITPGSGGNIILDGLIWPSTDGTNGQVLTTDGSGNLSFATPPILSELIFEQTVSISGDGTELSADLTNPTEIFILFSGISSDGTGPIRFVFSNSSGNISSGIYSTFGGASSGSSSPEVVILNGPAAASTYTGWIHAYKMSSQLWRIQHVVKRDDDNDLDIGGGYMDDGGDTTEFNGAFVANSTDVMDAGSWNLYYR